MSAQNCRIGKSIGSDGRVFILIERKRCEDSPCVPYGIIGSPVEGCENCNRTF